MTILDHRLTSPPDGIPTAAEHAAYVAGIETHGTSCHECGREASPAEVDGYLGDIRHDPEPIPWTCGLHDLDEDTRAATAREVCPDCRAGVHEPGTSDCPLEVA